MKRKYYNKLIRDKVPENMGRKDAAYETKKLNANEYRQELLKKVGEEASALPKCNNKEEIITELVDVEEVTDEIKRVFKITDNDLKEAREKGRRKKGGFKKRLFLFWSEDDGYQTNERRNV
ncbi:MAG: nucleoside triphosphate pyrophosphohydrolase [Patescibacteria group bacterium]